MVKSWLRFHHIPNAVESSWFQFASEHSRLAKKSPLRGCEVKEY